MTPYNRGLLMAHRITNGIERLSEKLSEGVGVDFFIASSNRQFSGVSIHGFGLIVIANGTRELQPIAGSSDSNKSSAPRGVLAGTLTALEWATINCEPGVQIRINTSNEYVYKHLPMQIDKWAADPRRVNHDLIAKIQSDYDAVGRDTVSFGHLLTSDPRYAAALRFAAAARDKRVDELVFGLRANVDDDDESPDLTLVDDNEWLFQQRLAKDP